MPTWIVGENQIVIERIAQNRISVEIPTRDAVVGDLGLIEDLVSKLLLALMDDVAGADPASEFRAVIEALNDWQSRLGAVTAARTGLPHQPGG